MIPELWLADKDNFYIYNILQLSPIPHIEFIINLQSSS